MKLRFNLRQFLIALIAASALFGFLYRSAYIRRSATHQLFENGFTLAYDQASVERGWKNEGFGGHRAVDKPRNSILDSPSNHTWLSFFGMLELANPIEVVDGKRTWLDKKSFDGFDNDDLKPIARLNAVKEVTLNWNSVDDDGLKYLSGLSSLNRLELDGCPVTDSGMVELANLKKIEYLSLAFTNVTDDGLHELRKLRNLKYLSLEGTDVSGDIYIHLKKFQHLETLKLSSTKIGQSEIEMIAELSRLKKLYIADTNVSDLDAILRNLPNLRWLVVDGTNVDDNLIASLKGNQLEGLSVDRTKGLSKGV